MIRVYKVEGMRFKLGIPVRFNGKVIGKTINTDEILIDNNDDVYKMLTGDKAEINLEVIRKYD